MRGSTGVGIARLMIAGFIVVTLPACRDSFGPANQQLKVASPTVSVRHPVYAQTVSSRKIPDEYIVVFDETVQDVHGRAHALASVAGSTVRREYTRTIRGYAAHMSAQAAAAIADHPGVAYVEQDQEVAANGVQSGAVWNLDRIDQSTLPLNGNYTYGPDGSGVNAYIIDSGIRRTHTQFTGRVVPAFTSINDGWGPDGCNYHGTHVAGTLGGVTYGVAKAVRLYSVRVLDCDGNGSLSDVLAGIEWVTANRQLPAVANMSLSSEHSDAFDAAVQASIASGVTYVVAAGNQGQDACLRSPASAVSTIAVGASTETDSPASFSNWGPCVDLYAPGVNILSAKSRDDYATGTLSGTSMASPHVAGAAALYLQLNPGASPAEVTQAVLSNATSGVLTPLGLGSPNLLVRVNGSGETVTPPPPVSNPYNSAPVASFSFKCAQNKNSCTFDASKSSDDSGITSMSWNFGDGSRLITATATTTNHVYMSKGTYTATLTVTDAAGLTSTAAQQITIKGITRQ
jgi:serine protease